MTDSDASVLKQTSPLLIAEKILLLRKVLGEGSWLCEELKVGLQELGGLLRQAGLDYEELKGLKPSLRLFSTEHSKDITPISVEAYSLRMMLNSLSNPGNNFVPHAQDSAVRKARRSLIELLGETLDLVTNPERFAVAKAKEQRQKDAEVHPSLSRDDLLAEALKFRKIKSYKERDPRRFSELFDRIWTDVLSGRLPRNSAAGKILNSIYETDDRDPDTPTAPMNQQKKTGPSEKPPSKSVTVQPESGIEQPQLTLMDSGFDQPLQQAPPSVLSRGAIQKALRPQSQQDSSNIGLALEPVAPAGSIAADRRPSSSSGIELAIETPEADPLDLSGLDDWVQQGRAGNRLFKEIMSSGDFAARIEHCISSPNLNAAEREDLFIRHFLTSVRNFDVQGQRLTFDPALSDEPLGFEPFEALMAEGVRRGSFEIDRRVWGVVSSAFRFLKNAYPLGAGKESA